MPNFVQEYNSTDLNAPPVTGQTGSWPIALDAVLVNGYGYEAVPITTLTASSTTATFTVSAANGLRITSGHILTISGAVETEYNLTATVTQASATTFTYQLGGTASGSPATGTILLSSKLPITGITRTDTTATATLSNSNTTLISTNHVKIEGANETEYNGTFEITSIDSTHFHYQVTGSPTTPATGTMKYYKAGLGWEIAFTDTNKRAYRSLDVASNQFYLRLDDSTTIGNAREAIVRAYESMTDIDSGTAPFPTVAQLANGISWQKSSTLDTVGRVWKIVGDDKTFYIYHSFGLCTLPYGFGHLISYTPGDLFNTFIGGPGYYTAITSLTQMWSQGGMFQPTWLGDVSNSLANCLFFARSYSQTGGSINGSVHDGLRNKGATQIIGSIANIYGLVYPNGPDAGFWAAPVSCVDFTGATFNIRGRMPGLYSHLHRTIPHINGDTATGVVGLSGVTLKAVTIHGSYNNTTILGMIHVDITGPWN